MRALVLGGGAGVWDEVLTLEALLGHQWSELIVAANDVGAHWPRELHHWCTLHPQKMKGWMQKRADYGFSNGFVTWGRNVKHCDRSIHEMWPGGSSGLLAVQVACVVGATHVVLCGVPMTATPHFRESTEEHIVDGARLWRHADKHWRAWERERERLQPIVRSMSGRTRDMLGAPDATWLRESETP